MLDAASIEAIAQRVAELLREDQNEHAGSISRALTAEQVADRLGVSVDWVYRHADELDARRLGQGERAPLRFDAEAVEAFGREGNTSRVTQSPKTRPRRRKFVGDPTNPAVELLPVGRRRAA